jgi:hypothetical protein
MPPEENNAPATARRALSSLDIGNLRRDGRWRGNELWFRRCKVAEIIEDGEWPNMWRVKLPDDSISDMVNRTRAKDAAFSRIGINP